MAESPLFLHGSPACEKFGLDEVRTQHRGSCVLALNRFVQKYGKTSIVVCSRIGDYEALSNSLRFQGAVYIRSLTLEQVNRYLVEVGSEVAGVRTLLRRDDTLQELARIPLTLSIMTLAYQGMTTQDLPNTNSVEEYRTHLFNNYIERMFFRRQSLQKNYRKEQSMQWLILMARSMNREFRSIFYIEQIHPYTWLQPGFQTCAYRIGIGLSFGIFFGLASNPIFLIFGLNIEVDLRTVIGTIIGLITARIPFIEPIETLKSITEYLLKSYSMKVAKRIFFLPIFIPMLLAIFKSVNILFYVMLNLLFPILLIVLFSAMESVLIRSDMKEETAPYQKFRESTIYYVLTALMYGALLTIFMISVSAVFGMINLSSTFNLHWELGLLCSLIVGLLLGSVAWIQHFTLRVVLWGSSFIPWNYRRFLDYATERIFLQKVGNGYIFIHRLLMEHFAQM